MQALKEYQSEYKQVKWLFEGARAGRYIPTRTVEKILGHACERTSIKKEVTVHPLRHSYAKWIINLKVKGRGVRMGLLPGDLEKVPQNLSIRDCYKRIYEWHKKYGRQRLVVKREIKDAYSKAYLALLEKLPHPDEVSESCMNFIFGEVNMLMEWSYHEQDEHGIKMAAYAHFAISRRYKGINDEKFKQSKEKCSLYKDFE